LADSSGLPRPKNPVALVTGASEGFGRELCRVIAADGYDLIVVARNVERLELLAKEISRDRGAQVDVYRADLARPEEQRALAERVAARPGLKVLVNNAAFSLVGPFRELSPDAAAQIVSLNLGALYLLSHAALGNADFRAGGTLLNIGSIGGSFPLPLDAAYSGTKAGVDLFTKGLAYETKQDPQLDVHVQLARLGGLSTDWADRAMGPLPPGEELDPRVEWLKNDPTEAARTIWRKTRLRKKAVIHDTFGAWLQTVLFGAMPRLASAFVYTNNHREYARRGRK